MTEKLRGLNRAIKTAEKKVAEEKRWGEEVRKKEERAEREFWRGERRNIGEKLRLAEDILRWSRKFCRSEEYRRLRRIGFSDYLTFYHSWWGHKREGRGFGCVSTLYLRKDGTFYYSTRYKWFPYPYKRTFKTARELAKRLTRDYLKELHQFIATGRVYDKLRKEVKEA